MHPLFAFCSLLLISGVLSGVIRIVGAPCESARVSSIARMLFEATQAPLTELCMALRNAKATVAKRAIEWAYPELVKDLLRVQRTNDGAPTSGNQGKDPLRYAGVLVRSSSWLVQRKLDLRSAGTRVWRRSFQRIRPLPSTVVFGVLSVRDQL